MTLPNDLPFTLQFMAVLLLKTPHRSTPTCPSMSPQIRTFFNSFLTQIGQHKYQICFLEPFTIFYYAVKIINSEHSMQASQLIRKHLSMQLLYFEISAVNTPKKYNILSQHAKFKQTKCNDVRVFYPHLFSRISMLKKCHYHL